MRPRPASAQRLTTSPSSATRRPWSASSTGSLAISTGLTREVGAGRIGVRLAPFITARNMACPDIIPTLLLAARELSLRDIGYLHLGEADWDDAPRIPDDLRIALRAAFTGRIVGAGGYGAARARSLRASGLVDLIAFGRPFIANPDLPARIAVGLPPAGFDGGALFGGTAKGYSDYPAATAA